MNLINKIFNKKNPQLGSAKWLIRTEQKYGGYHKSVKRNKVSNKDPRSPKEISTGGMIGGDRMHPRHHGYAQKYSEYLSEVIQNQEPKIIAEFGILKGVGLAIWCDLFPKSYIYGFDIDLGHINNNMDSLIELGAFRYNKPILHEYDQLEKNDSYLTEILNGQKIDICIDDGLHSNDSILITLESVLGHLNKGAIYFIEDNKNVYKEIEKKYNHLSIDNVGKFTVLTGF